MTQTQRSKVEATLVRIADLLEKQQKDQAVKDSIQIHSGLSVVAAFIASLSLSLLSYAASLAQSNALTNDALLVLNSIWFITTGGSLFIAGCTGIVAAAAGLGPSRYHPHSNTKYRRWGSIIIILGLFTMLFTMVGGFIVLSNSLAVNTPLGNVHLPAVVIYPLLAAAVVLMVLLSVFMLWYGR
ncbi:hypothetical protein B0H13DRAFT_2519692 [Mycena leptocephala]|nr:hypothetical protein B0H13DRAFT_2519692 [Mycena leptocephala]